MKKRKGWRGATTRPMVLNASALPLHHSDLLVHIHYIIEERRRNTTGRSGVVVGRWRSIIYRRFPSSQRFVFFTRRRRRRVSIYQSYYRREEAKYSRSEWGRGKALASTCEKDKLWRGANPRSMDKAYDSQHMLLCWL